LQQACPSNADLLKRTQSFGHRGDLGVNKL
jgi:hypothetical protein